MKYLKHLCVFESGPLPPYTKAIPVKWVFKLKTGEDGTPLRTKPEL